MALWVRSRRYSDRMVQVGRLCVVFRGEHAELPDWAVREYAWMITHLPGVTPSQPPAAVFGVDERVAPAPTAEVPAAPSDAAATDEREAVGRVRPPTRRGR